MDHRTFTDALTGLAGIVARIEQQISTAGSDRPDRRHVARLRVERDAISSAMEELRSLTDADDVGDVPARIIDLAGYLAPAYTSGTLPTHPLAGGIPTRTRAGHCWVCAVVGHPVAHPDRDCSAVGCQADHRVEPVQVSASPTGSTTFDLGVSDSLAVLLMPPTEWCSALTA